MDNCSCFTVLCKLSVKPNFLENFPEGEELMEYAARAGTGELRGAKPIYDGPKVKIVRTDVPPFAPYDLAPLK